MNQTTPQTSAISENSVSATGNSVSATGNPAEDVAATFLQSITAAFSPQTSFLLLVCFAFLAVTAFLGEGEVKSNSTRKNAKGRARWASKKEINAARRLAIQQLNRRSRKSACAYIITPKILKYPESVLKRKKVKTAAGEQVDSSWVPAPEMGAIPKESPVVVKGERHRFYSEFDRKMVTGETIWLPDTQRSIMVVGGPGSGKTFSAIDPIIRSFIQQGYPILLYDFKYPTQTSCHAWYAKQLGYKIHVFAPGFPESDVCNLLDFLKGDPEQDSALARQLANVLNANFKIGQATSGDPFFDNAGDQLVQAVMMLARQMPSPDLMTAQVILSAPQMVDRLFPESSGLDPWTRKAFDQIFSVKDSEKTVSSIIGTATMNFTRLMMARILACCVGKSTIPLNIDGKTMVIFGLDREIRDVVSPIVATVLHMLINENLFRPGGRKDPLCVILDEFPTLCLRQVKNWLNESRSDGFNSVIGLQNMTQIKKTYGDEDAKAIVTGCATKIIFNPGEVESAEYFSRMFGDEEIARRNISRSSGGGKGGVSRSRSIEVATRKLVAPEEFLGLPPGIGVLANPAYDNGESSYLPRRIKFNIPPGEIALQELAEQNWEPFREQLIARAAKFQKVPTKEDVLLRMRQFDEKFPIPKDDADQKGGNGSVAQFF